MRISDWSSDVCSSDLSLAATEMDTSSSATTSLPSGVLKRFRAWRISRIGGTSPPPAACGGDAAADAAWPIASIPIPTLTARPLLPDAIHVCTGEWRSEERRVGKECVSPCSTRWWPSHEKKQEKKKKQ